MKEEWNRNFEVIEKGNFGFPLWKIEDFRAVLDYFADNLTDEMIDIHTIGDMAIETALIEIRRIKARNPRLRFSLIHVYAPEERQLELMKSSMSLWNFNQPSCIFTATSWLTISEKTGSRDSCRRNHSSRKD